MAKKKEEKENVSEKSQATETVEAPVQSDDDSVLTPPPAAEEKKTEKPKSEKMVSIPESTLQDILAKQKELEDMVTETADISRLTRYVQKKKGALIPQMSVALWEVDGKESIVRGWKTIKDDVYVEPGTGRVIEEQKLELYLDGDETVVVTHVEFLRNAKRRLGEVVKSSKTDTGEFKTLRFPDGDEVEMNIIFLNL